MWTLAVVLTVYALWFDSIPASVLAAAVVLYRAQRPGQFRNRLNDFRYAQQVAQVGSDDPVA